jgi:ATP-dependent DNA ligase
MQTLYKKDNTGKIRVWNILEQLDGEIVITHGVLHGALQEKTEYVGEGLAGRSLEEQVESRINSRIMKQLDKGYVWDLDKAVNNKVTNSLGLLKPMLAKHIKHVRKIDYTNAYYQHKYDGNRCLITKQEGRMIAYSRNGKPISSIDHIVDGIEIGEGQTLDGELYCHGVPLQRIASWIKREQDATKSLSYNVYDLISPDPYHHRLEILKGIKMGDHANVVPTTRVYDHESAMALFKISIYEGYEGGIIRWGDEGYRDDYRAKHLVKVKQLFDDEFEVNNIIPSNDGWAILICTAKCGKDFRVTAPGTMVEKFHIIKYKQEYIGKSVRVEYSQLTNDKIPFHPVATMWRNKEDE